MESNTESKKVKQLNFAQKTAIMVAIIIAVNAIMFVTAFLVYRYVVMPYPIERKYYNIDYTNSDDSVVKVVENNIDNIVEIKAGQKLGTGVIYDYDGDKPLIITNYHVLEGANSYGVKLSYELSFTNNATLIGYDSYHDIAVLKLDRNMQVKHVLRQAKPISSQSLKMGQKIVAIGNNLGKGLAVCDGVISKTSKVLTSSSKTIPVVQTTAPANNGYSGGALLDMKGELIGINTYQSTNVENVAYSVPMELVSVIYDKIMTSSGADLSSEDTCMLLEPKDDSAFYLTMKAVGADFNFVGAEENGEYKIYLFVRGVHLGSNLALGQYITKFGDLAITDDNYASVLGEYYKYDISGSGKPLSLTLKGNSTITIDGLKLRF